MQEIEFAAGDRPFEIHARRNFLADFACHAKQRIEMRRRETKPLAIDRSHRNFGQVGTGPRRQCNLLRADSLFANLARVALHNEVVGVDTA